MRKLKKKKQEDALWLIFIKMSWMTPDYILKVLNEGEEFTAREMYEKKMVGESIPSINRHLLKMTRLQKIHRKWEDGAYVYYGLRRSE